ncbi:MAG TPA: DUF2336 domain-containing protein [Acetobacteraceae bacterium]
MTDVAVRSAPTLPNEETRVRIGANPDSPPAVLERLAVDTAVMVRAALALNPATPPTANRVLARDADERVRALLARKLAGLAPGLTAGEHSRLQHEAYETLIALVEDEAVRVRAAITDVLKQMPDAPRSLILRLARDIALEVNEPVIRFSPMLTTEDLLALVSKPPAPTTLIAVARRPDLNARVADAIADGEHHEAIRELLANPSAQIREATLDALIARAADHADWHEPLVQRPSLPPRSAKILSQIVATHLLQVLASRADLEPKLLEELGQRLTQRLQERGPVRVTRGDLSTEQALAEAHRLLQRGKLSETVIFDAIQRNELRLVSALLATAAGMPVTVVDRAVSLRSAKGLVSLAWKAGFSMDVARSLQTALAHLPPSAVLSAGADGGYPLSSDEMRWQVDFLRRVGR